MTLVQKGHSPETDEAIGMNPDCPKHGREQLTYCTECKKVRCVLCKAHPLCPPEAQELLKEQLGGEYDAYLYQVEEKKKRRDAIQAAKVGSSLTTREEVFIYTVNQMKRGKAYIYIYNDLCERLDPKLHLYSLEELVESAQAVVDAAKEFPGIVKINLT